MHGLVNIPVQLRSENERMKSELQKSQEETKLEKERYLVLHMLQQCDYRHILMDTIIFLRNKTLREQLKVLKKKDAEDTKALEDMVQKVEENLVTTTVSRPFSRRLKHNA